VSGAQLWPLAMAALWLIAANILAMRPAQDGRHGRSAILVATGVPLLGWTTFALGPVAGVALFALGAAMLRWRLTAERA